MKKFNNSQEAFEYYYEKLNKTKNKKDNTNFLKNVLFCIKNPLDNEIKTSWRKWKKTYALLEWDWYLSGNRSVEEIKKHAKIWDKMHNGDNIVNSNYGYQWNRNNQIDYIVKELSKNKNSRRAVLTIYDAKEHSSYEYDTPCTLNVTFDIHKNKLNMTVMMRSNDIWFGFCNDQFCFSMLQKLIADKLNKQIGYYYHIANDLHLYHDFLNKNK